MAGKEAGRWKIICVLCCVLCVERIEVEVGRIKNKLLDFFGWSYILKWRFDLYISYRFSFRLFHLSYRFYSRNSCPCFHVNSRVRIVRYSIMLVKPDIVSGSGQI